MRNDYPIRMVNFWEVEIEDEFWKQKLEVKRKVTIPHILQMKEFKIYIRIAGAIGNPVPLDLYKYLDKKDRDVSVKLNGRIIPLNLEKGYLQIKRRWKKGEFNRSPVPNAN